MRTLSRAFGALPILFVSLASADEAAKDTTLDEVVVTAQLRSRALGALPASVTVLESRTLEMAGVQHFEEVLGLVPNLNWSAGTSRPRFFQLRGIGELEQWQGAPNPSVGFLIDGVDFSGIGMPATLADVERIEVLRGPQGTAYGANALAGLIAVNTRAPSREPEMRADLSFGDYGTLGVNGIVGGAVGDGESAWRLVAGKYRSDGFRRNSYLGRNDTNGYDESSARLKLHAQPTGQLSADVTAMWVDLDNGYDAFSIDNSRTTLSDRPGQDTLLARAVSARLDWRGADSFDMQARGAYGTARSVYSFDGDWGNAVSWGVNGPYDYFQRFDRVRSSLSTDLRILSRASVDRGASFAWLAGAYALRTTEDVEQNDTYNGDVAAFLVSDYRASNLAVYGELEWAMREGTVFSLGVRGERRDADYADSNDVAFAPAETMFGGTLSVRHAFDARRSVYASLARGYKAGGVNIRIDVPVRSFDAETLNSLELGARFENEAASLAGDVALFYMRRKDQQVPTSVHESENPLGFILYTDNAARGENYGVEGTLRWTFRPAWLLDLRAALLESRYLGYRFGEIDLDGREQAHAPQYQYDLGLEYRGAHGAFARIDLAGVDDFFFDATHDERAPARMLTHLKAGYSGNHWRAEVWVRNLFDRYYAQRGFRFGNEPPEFIPTRYVQAGDPRHAGVTVAYTFR
jgi:iron complex outermembrane recepter protein